MGFWFDLICNHNLPFFNFGLLSLVVKNLCLTIEGVCLEKFAPQRDLKIMLLGICLLKISIFFFLVKIQWHYIPEHCITELENNIMYANFNLFQYAFARSSSNTQNLLSTIRSILEELYISNASSSGFDPHFLCLTFSLYDVSKGTFNYTNFLFSTH